MRALAPWPGYWMRSPARSGSGAGGRGQARAGARARRGRARRRAVGHRPGGHRGAYWSEDDDRSILANMKAPARELGLALGRTSWAVYRRRRKLRRRLETQTGKTMRLARRGKRV